MIIKLTDAVIKIDLGEVSITAKSAEVITHESDCVIEPIEKISTKAEMVITPITPIIPKKREVLCCSCNRNHECGNQSRVDCYNYSPALSSGKYDPAPGKPEPKKRGRKQGKKSLTKQEPKFGICIDCGAPCPGKKRCEACNVKKYPWLRNKKQGGAE